VPRYLLPIVEIVILSVLLLATRCANHADVFVAGNVYFTDADCYARMTRVRLCAQHPGLIVRHHGFENFPEGTSPHTTAPLDYLVLGLSIALRPFTAHAIDLAGALISPLLALLAGWFLWWWSREQRFKFRWALLLLFAVSPILVHGTELGRPDHQSLLILLVTVALCAEWTLQFERSKRWGVVSGSAWGLALWVSLYEPVVLLFLVVVLGLGRGRLLSRHRRLGWGIFGSILVLALALEQRLPAWPLFHSSPLFHGWSQTIGELARVSPADPVWFGWTGYMLVLAPFLIWHAFSRRDADVGKMPWLFLFLLVATYLSTVAQARWAYFFVLIFALLLPSLLQPFQSRLLVWIAVVLSFWPVAREWDRRIWPGEMESARRLQDRQEAIEVHEMALLMMSSETQPFVAPWWLSPAIAYWSGQPGVAGSSHESLSGITDTARIFLAGDPGTAADLLRTRQVRWVWAYDADRVAGNSAALLGAPVPPRPFCRVLDRNPAQAPPFLRLRAQNSVSKLFMAANNR